MLSALTGCALNGVGGRCVLEQQADLKVPTGAGVPVIAAKVDGQPATFFVDTGTGLSWIGRRAARRLGLPVNWRKLYGIDNLGFDEVVPAVEVSRLDVGGATGADVTFAAAGLFDAAPPLKLAGNFGGDFLSKWDVEFDLPRRRIRLFREEDCGTDFTPYDAPFAAIPFRKTPTAAIDVVMSVDRRPLHALLDSGTAGTILRTGDAGLTPNVTGARRPVLGVFGHLITVSLAHVDDLAVGAVHDRPFTIEVGDTAKTLLGADWLRRHTVWISYPHDTLFVPLAPTAR